MGTGQQPAAELGRAKQRLAQESSETRTGAIGSPEQAQARIDRLKAQISADPESALRALAGVDGGRYETAMARPTA